MKEARKATAFAAGLCLAAIAGVPLAGRAQPAACGCAQELDALVEKVEANYIGYHLLLPTLDRAAYDSGKAALRKRAEHASDDDCVAALSDYVEQFHDPHLFVSEQPELAPEETARRAAAAESLPWDEAKARAYLDRNAGKLDPVEGIWYSDRARFAIVRDPGRADRDFVAVLLSDLPGWKAGQVKGGFRKRADGTYDARMIATDRGIRHLRGEIYKHGLLLRMAPVVWGRAYPVAPVDAGVLDPGNPRNPTLRVLADGTVVVSMPSHDGPYRDVLAGLVTSHLEALRKAPLLVIDVRGDEGGGAQTSAPLEPFYVSARRRPRPHYEGKEVVVASADLANYYERLSKEMEPGGMLEKRFTELVARMRREPGRVLKTDIWGNQPTAEPAVKPAAERPRKVAIVMDRGSVSAAEAFVLAAWEYEGVTIYGDNSGGSIDYQSVSMRPLACTLHSMWVGYPTMGGSETLPRGGFNATGIPPDVRIPADASDPIGFVVTHERGDKR